MTRSISEADWKVFRQLHPIALNRYCQRVLLEIERITEDASKTPHQRYLALYKLIEQRDRDLGRAFNDLRRSTALLQLSLIHSYGVLTEEEMARFSEETRAHLSFL